MRGRLRAAALATALALAGTACGQGTPTAPPPPDGVSIRGSATISMPRPVSLDPSNVLDASGEMVVRTMCDPLLDVDRDTGEIVPALVQSWIVTDGGLRIVLRLRDGLTFPDGSEVTAQDVVFSLSRAVSAGFAGQNADLFEGVLGHRVLRGQDEAKEPRHRRELAGLRVVSRTAFELNLAAGAQTVLPQLTHPTASLLSAAAAEADPRAFAAAPLCVGPYRPLSPFDPDADTFALERVDTYAGVDEAHVAGGQGFLERLTFHWTEPEGLTPAREDAPRTAPPTFEEFDVVLVDGAQARAATAGGEHAVLTASRPSAQYVGVPDSQLPAAGRRALSMALDRGRIADVLGRDRVGPLTAFLPPSLGSALHRPDACGSTMGSSADVAAARRVLAEAGVDLAGFTLPVVTNPDFDNPALVAEVVRQWRSAFTGFNPVAREATWEQMRVGFEDPAGFVTAVRTSQVVPYPSPWRWLSVFRTAAIGRDNPVAFADGLFDELVDLDAARATDPVDQRVVFHEAEERLCEAMPLIPLVHGQRQWSVTGDLASATGDVQDLADPVTGGIRLRDLHRPS